MWSDEIVEYPGGNDTLLPEEYRSPARSPPRSPVSSIETSIAALPSHSKALLYCSHYVHSVMTAMVHDACYQNRRNLPLTAIQNYWWAVDGKSYRFVWSVFVHGIARRVRSRKTVYDRRIWKDQGLLTPFDDIRQQFAKMGYFVMLRYEGKQPIAVVMTKQQVLCCPQMTRRNYKGKEVTVWGSKIAWHTFNIVPF